MILLICSPGMVEKCSPLDDIVNSYGGLIYKMSSGEEKKDVLQLGKEGMDDPSGGAAAPRTPPLFFVHAIFTKNCSVWEPSPEAVVVAIRSIRRYCTRAP